MKKRLTVLFLTLLLCGCTARNEPPVIQEPSVQPTPAPPTTETPIESPQLPLNEPEVRDSLVLEENIATITLNEPI